jgi:uncharacterized membrane-anchored protein
MSLGASISLLTATVLALIALAWLVVHIVRSPERTKDRRR